MVIIQVSRATLAVLSDDELETYLVSSGKPPRLAYHIDGTTVSWASPIDYSKKRSTFEPEPEPEPSKRPPVDFQKMTKEKIEQWTLDNFAVNLDTRKMTKAQMIQAASELYEIEI